MAAVMAGRALAGDRRGRAQRQGPASSDRSRVASDAGREPLTRDSPSHAALLPAPARRIRPQIRSSPDAAGWPGSYRDRRPIRHQEGRETATQRSRAGPPWPSAMRRAPAPSSHGAGAGRQAGWQKGSPDQPIVPGAQTLAGMSHGRVEAPCSGLYAWGDPWVCRPSPTTAAEACLNTKNSATTKEQ